MYWNEWLCFIFCHVSFYSGAFSFEEGMSVGGKDEHDKVQEIKKTIQFDDAVNIQFTSVCKPFVFCV